MQIKDCFHKRLISSGRSGRSQRPDLLILMNGNNFVEPQNFASLVAPGIMHCSIQSKQKGPATQLQDLYIFTSIRALL